MIEASKIERENHRYTLLMMSEEMPIFLIMGFVFVPFITTSIISFVIIYRPLQGFFNCVIFMSHIYNVYNLFRSGTTFRDGKNRLYDATTAGGSSHQWCWRR
jgi:hypothetical protein